MVEQPLGVDEVTNAPPKSMVLGPLILAAIMLAMVWAAITFCSPFMVVAFRIQLPMFTVLLFVNVTLGCLAWLHRGDRLVIDDHRITAFSRGGDQTIEWDEANRLRADLGGARSSLKIYAGKRRITVRLAGLAEDLPVAQRLRTRLEPVWQRSLERLEDGPERALLPLAMAALCGGLMLLFVVPASIWPVPGHEPPRDPGTIVGLLLFAIGLSALTGWSTVRRVGKGCLWHGPLRVRLDGVQTIRIRRIGGFETWALKLRRRLIELPGPDPLLCEHIIRHCPHATYEYDIRSPRTPLEAIFLPLPPGATEDTMVAADQPAADRATWRSRRVVAVQGLAMAGFISGLFPTMFFACEWGEDLSWQRHGIEVTGQLVKGRNGWDVAYHVDGEAVDGMVLNDDALPLGSTEGDSVVVVYKRAYPNLARPKASLGTLRPDLRALGIGWLVALAFALLGALVTVRHRRSVGPQPRAVGF